MRIIIVGPGRAGLSLAIAATAVGHQVVAIVGKDQAQADDAVAEFPAAVPLTADQPFPAADLLVVATRDGAIAPVAAALAGSVGEIRSAVHLSGLTPVGVLAPLADAGLMTGAFHPLQTLPTPQIGAARLDGSWIGVTALAPLRDTLHEFAVSLGALPFDLEDDAKALYHAGAAAAANFPLAALTMAHDLFEAAGVPFEAAGPLIRAVVENALALGPRAALTGPVARGDVETVRAQLDAISAAEPEWLPGFAALALQVARIAGKGDDFEELFLQWRPGERP